MADTTTTSGLFSLDWKDLGKGLLLAVITSVLTVVYDSVSNGSLDFDWKKIGTIAATSAIGYLIKNLLTPPATVVKQ